MRILLSSLLILFVLVGCQQRQQGTLQNTVDSLQAVNQNLERQVQVMRDTLRARQSTGPETTLTPPVYFPSGSAWIPDRGRQTLDQHAQTLNQRYPNSDFRIQGYTDNVPIGPSLKNTYPSNWYLSAQRAAAVAHYLDTEHGIQTQTLEIEAFGPKAPVAPNQTSEGRQQNRRVEIVVQE